MTSGSSRLTRLARPSATHQANSSRISRARRHPRRARRWSRARPAPPRDRHRRRSTTPPAPTAERRVAGEPGEPAARGVALPAAAAAAHTRRPVRVDDHVPGLAGEPVRAPLQHAAAHDAAADAGAERDEQRVGRARRGAVPPLGLRSRTWRRCRPSPGSSRRSTSMSRIGISVTPIRFGRRAKHAARGRRARARPPPPRRCARRPSLRAPRRQRRRCR